MPELKFALANAQGASIETKTVYDGDDDYVGTEKHFFKTSLPGEYTVHVEPLKASEYAEPMDDMLIRVVKGKKVARIEFKNIDEVANPEDLMINIYTSQYPSVDLSTYLNYYDGYGELIDPVKDHVKIPDCTYTVVPLDDKDADTNIYSLNRGIFTAYEPEYFFVKAEMNVTNNDSSNADAQEDTILEATTGFSVNDIDWLHDFSGGWTMTKEPTCTQDGVRVKRCSGADGCINHKDGEAGGCSAEIVDVVPATGHKWSKYYRFDASDKSLYAVCEACGAVNEESRTYCHGTPNNGWADAAHKVPNPVQVATCTSVGKYRVSTSEGDDIIEVPALGHTWSGEFSVTKAPTCTATGEESISCSCEGCDAIREGADYHRAIPKLAHEAADPDVSHWAYFVDEDGNELKETCEGYGFKVATCKNENCEEKLYEMVAPLGHDWGEGEVVTPATNRTSGIVRYTCTHGCGATKTEVIEAFGGQEAVDAAAAADTAIAGVAKLNAQDYSAESYKAVTDARDALNAALADPNATAAQIKSATSRLEGAVKALVKSQPAPAANEGSQPASVEKAEQSMSVKKKTVKVKVKKVKKKAQTVKALTVKNYVGKLTFKGKGVNKKSKKALKINVKTGKITVKKKTKKGTYKIKVTVTAAGDESYAERSKKVTVTIKVK